MEAICNMKNRKNVLGFQFKQQCNLSQLRWFQHIMRTDDKMIQSVSAPAQTCNAVIQGRLSLWMGHPCCLGLHIVYITIGVP